MNISVVAAALLIVVGLVGTLGAADARSKRTCKLKNSKTYKSNKSARLFTRKETRDTFYVTALYGCHRGTKKRVFLATQGGYHPDDYLVKLQGRFVAVNYTETDSRSVPAQSSGFLRLWDLKRPKRLQNIKDVDVSDIEIGPQGQLVWIGRPLANEGEAEQPLSVRVGNRALATGNIAPESLVIKGSTVSWTQDGAPRSAELTP